MGLSPSLPLANALGNGAPSARRPGNGASGRRAVPRTPYPRKRLRGVKSASNPLEPILNRGRTPFLWGKGYPDLRFSQTISIDYGHSTSLVGGAVRIPAACCIRSSGARPAPEGCYPRGAHRGRAGASARPRSRGGSDEEGRKDEAAEGSRREGGASGVRRSTEDPRLGLREGADPAPDRAREDGRVDPTPQAQGGGRLRRARRGPARAGSSSASPST